MANPHFTDEDRLRLLQLMTRRAMAERRGRAAARERDDLETDARGKASPMTVAIAPRWRLVPEGTSLYDWQQKALPLWLSHGRGTVKKPLVSDVQVVPTVELDLGQITILFFDHGFVNRGDVIKNPGYAGS
jgi:hypothetical protein